MGFCPSCGTPLTFAYRGSGKISVTTGSLDETAAHPPTVAYGIEGRASWFDEICRLPGSRTEDDVPDDDLARYRSLQQPDGEA